MANPQGKSQCKGEALEARPLLELEEAGDLFAFGEDVGTWVSAVGHDGDDWHPRSLSYPDEAGSGAQHDLVATASMAIGVEVAIGIDQHLRASAKGAKGVFGLRAKGAETLDHGAERLKMPHHKVVRESVERRLGAARVP